MSGMQEDMNAIQADIDVMKSDIGHMKATLRRHEDDISELKKGQERIFVVLDGIAERLETDDHERLAISAQVDRHERWVVRASQKVGVGYAPGEL